MKKNKKKIVTILGTRPQFIKATSLSREINLNSNLEEIILNTNQHYDSNMSDVFIKQLKIKQPKYNLEIFDLSHGAMLGRMIEKIEKILKIERPDIVCVYGDTNSTLAGALAACKMDIKIAHIEAGLRSNNHKMPEEYNRIITDRISTILFCPSKNSLINLKNEGFPHMVNNENQSIQIVGDIMYDTFLFYKNWSLKSICLKNWNLHDKQFAYCTLHRPVNVDNENNLSSILNGLVEINKKIKIVISIHPRTEKNISKFGLLSKLSNLIVIKPQPYLENLRLILGSKLILTDSGGMQKEAFFSRVPCITLRNETEWIETLKNKSNILAGSNCDKIMFCFKQILKLSGLRFNLPYGRGNTRTKIVNFLNRNL